MPVSAPSFAPPLPEQCFRTLSNTFSKGGPVSGPNMVPKWTQIKAKSPEKQNSIHSRGMSVYFLAPSPGRRGGRADTHPHIHMFTHPYVRTSIHPHRNTSKRTKSLAAVPPPAVAFASCFGVWRKITRLPDPKTNLESRQKWDQMWVQNGTTFGPKNGTSLY
jgi:hypothetical protein